MLNNPPRILILGGTAEARLLAGRLEEDDRFTPLTSLAGVTARPSKIAGQVRVGGFGGADGLADFIEGESISLMVDATHPFAAQISAHAAQASTRSGVPCLRLVRPPWERRAGDDWRGVADIEEAVRAIPAGARALVTVGRQEAARFFVRGDIEVIARMIEPSDARIPENAEVLLDRPPFTLAREKALMEEKRISILVTKNSGGDATFAKIEAARELDLPVIMIARPEKAAAVTVASMEKMLKLIEVELR